MNAYEILIVINVCIALGIVGGCIVLATMKIADCIIAYKDWQKQKREIIELRKRWLERQLKKGGNENGKKRYGFRL